MESLAGGAAKVDRFIGGRAMAHPRQSADLYTVYNNPPGRQPGFEPEFKPGRFLSPATQGSCHPLMFLVE
jgi:hypothetical protein